MKHCGWVEVCWAAGWLFVSASVAGCRSHAQEVTRGTEAAAVTKGATAGMPTDNASQAPISRVELRSALVQPGSPEAKNFASVFKQMPPPYHPGEELTFSFKWSGISAGRASLKVLEVPEPLKGRKVLKLDSVIESNAFVSAFYRVRDHSYSLVDAETGFSRYYYLDKKEKRSEYLDTIEYDYDKGTALYNRHEKGTDNPKQFPIYGPVSDVVSVVHYYRQIPKLAVGDVVEVPLSTESEVFYFKMKVDDKDLIKVYGVGTVRALRVSPAEDVENGPAMCNTGSCMWIEEVTHIPLRVTIDLAFGSITMYLSDVDNVPEFKALDSKQIRAAKKDGY